MITINLFFQSIKYICLRLMIMKNITEFDLIILKKYIYLNYNQLNSKSSEYLYIPIMKQFRIDLKQVSEIVKILFFEVLDIFLKTIKLTKPSMSLDLFLQFSLFISSKENETEKVRLSSLRSLHLFFINIRFRKTCSMFLCHYQLRNVLNGFISSLLDMLLMSRNQKIQKMICNILEEFFYIIHYNNQIEILVFYFSGICRNLLLIINNTRIKCSVVIYAIHTLILYLQITFSDHNYKNLIKIKRVQHSYILNQIYKQKDLILYKSEKKINLDIDWNINVQKKITIIIKIIFDFNRSRDKRIIKQIVSSGFSLLSSSSQILYISFSIITDYILFVSFNPSYILQNYTKFSKFKIHLCKQLKYFFLSLPKVLYFEIEEKVIKHIILINSHIKILNDFSLTSVFIWFSTYFSSLSKSIFHIISIKLDAIFYFKKKIHNCSKRFLNVKFNKLKNNILQNSIISFLRLLGRTFYFKIYFVIQLFMVIFRDLTQTTIHLETLFTINQIIYGAKNKINLNLIFELIILELVQSVQWNFLLNQKNKIHLLKRHTILICLILESLMLFSQRYPQTLELNLTHLLYPILEKTGSQNDLIRHTSFECIQCLYISLCLNSLENLLLINKDYLFDCIITKLTSKDEKKCLDMLISLLNVISPTIVLFILKDALKFFLRKIIIICQRLETKKLFFYLKITNVLVFCSRKSIFLKKLKQKDQKRKDNFGPLEVLLYLEAYQFCNNNSFSLVKNKNLFLMEIPSSFQEQIFFNFNNHKNCQRKNNENFNKLNQIINKLCEYNIYLLYHQKVEIRLLALNIIYESLFILKKDEKLLLPLIAKIWKNLHVLLEETNKTILLKVSSILFQICNFSDVFFKKRLELNAWSSLKKIVLLCKSELLNEIIVTETRLKFSCRILVDIFRSFTLLSKIDNIILPFLLECGSIIVSFLSPSYPSILKQEAKRLLISLACHDEDYIWYLLIQTFPYSHPLVPKINLGPPFITEGIEIYPIAVELLEKIKFRSEILPYKYLFT